MSKWALTLMALLLGELLVVVLAVGGLTIQLIAGVRLSPDVEFVADIGGILVVTAWSVGFIIARHERAEIEAALHGFDRLS